MKDRYVARVYLVPDVLEKNDDGKDPELTIQEQTTSQFDEGTQQILEVQGDTREEISMQIMRRVNKGVVSVDNGPGAADVGNNS